MSCSVDVAILQDQRGLNIVFVSNTSSAEIASDDLETYVDVGDAVS